MIIVTQKTSSIILPVSLFPTKIGKIYFDSYKIEFSRKLMHVIQRFIADVSKVQVMT